MNKAELIAQQIAGISIKMPWYSRAEIDQMLAKIDLRIVYENFNIITADNGDGTFTYQDERGVNKLGKRSPEGYQTFKLEQGIYNMHQNRISAIVNDTLHRSAASGGLREDSVDTVTLTAPAGSGSEVTFIYFTSTTRIGSGVVPVVSSTEPKPPDIFDGFIWIDMG